MAKKRVKNDREYFAAIEDPAQLANAMQQKIAEWREYCDSHGLIGNWKKKLTNYYGVSASGNSSQALTAGGAKGELTIIKVNDLRSLIQEQLVIVTGQRPAGIARAINSNTESLKSSRIGSAIAEYYMNEKQFETKFISTTEIALLCDEGYLDIFWDKSAGDPIAVDPDTDIPEMSGDGIIRTHAPWNVARDPGLAIEQQKWNILSIRANRFDEAAKYPRFAERILSVKGDDLPVLDMDVIPEGSDAIFVHLLVHDRTAAVPSGRYSLMIGEDIVLDSSLKFDDYPVERIAPSDVIDGPTGYAPSNDIMALEEVTDALHSIITTNEVTFGGQCIVSPQGLNIEQSDLAKGVRFFELPADMCDKLRSLELVKTAPEIFNYINLLGMKKEKVVGSVQSSLAQQAQQGASGSSMALIQTQAISFNSGTQRGYFCLLSRTMTKFINMLRIYADTPRVARIVGKSKAAGMKEFKYSGGDLSSISSIVYEMVNPMAQTYGGRLTMGQDLLKAGQIKSPKQYVNLVQTGQTDVLTEDDEADGMLILEENEALTEGRMCQAVITEIHMDHIKSHNSMITQEAKENDPDLVDRVTTHVQQHINLWMQASLTNPGILLATGQQPLMPPQQQLQLQSPGPTQQKNGQDQGIAGGEGIGKLIGGGEPPAETIAGEVRQPSLPDIAGKPGEKPTIPGVTDQGIH